jgi:hypothetical protein
MRSAHKLLFPRLSDSLEMSLLKISDDFLLKEWNNEISRDLGGNAFTEFTNSELEKAQEYHVHTNTSAGNYRSFRLPVLLEQEIKKEISNSIVDDMNFYLQIITSNSNNQTYCLAPHIDPYRQASLIYNLVDDDVSTNFYMALDKLNDLHAFNLNEISGPVESYKFSMSSWWIMNNKSIHSVTDISKIRIAVSAPINQSYLDFYETNKNICQ